MVVALSPRRVMSPIQAKKNLYIYDDMTTVDDVYEGVIHSKAWLRCCFGLQYEKGRHIFPVA